MSPQLSNQAKPFLPIFKVWADGGSHPPVKLDRPVCVIGRREGGVNLPLHSPQVSKLHALVVRDKEQVYLRDLASTNGVHRNGAPVQEVGLSDEDVIRIGSYTLRCDSGFSPHADHSDSEVGAAPAPAPAYDDHVLPAAELRGERVSFPFPVGQHTVLIGRRNGCDLRLDDDDVAPVHAIVFQLDGKRHVRDLSAPGGTALNGRLIHQEELKPGDELRVGNVAMRYTLLDMEHDESDVPPLDEPHVPELDEPDIDALPDAEPELSAMEESRIPLLEESHAPAAEAPAPPPGPAVAASEAPVPSAQVEPKLDPSESHLGMNDSFVSIEDSQAPGTPDAGPQDSNVLEPPASAEASFHGEVVQYAGEVFAAHPEAVAREDAVVKPPPPPAPKEAAIKPSPLDHLTPLGSHADDVHADPSPQSRPQEISKLVDEVAEKAGTLKEVWSEYDAEQSRAKHDPDVTHPAP